MHSLIRRLKPLKSFFRLHPWVCVLMVFFFVWKVGVCCNASGFFQVFGIQLARGLPVWCSELVITGYLFVQQGNIEATTICESLA